MMALKHSHFRTWNVENIWSVINKLFFKSLTFWIYKETLNKEIDALKDDISILRLRINLAAN